MERKRKLPARAAARGEHVSKRRNATPRERSETPAAAAPPPTPPEPEEPPPPPLPNSIQSGQPLPTVEVAQPEDLPTKDFQSVGESGVLVESLSRSRQKWICDGLFAKYWTKPHKRKGVLIEDPKNPPKDTMSKVGTVTVTIEPHIIEATMYVVKDPKPRAQQPPPQQQAQQKQTQPQTQQQAQQQAPLARPIIQYGPPNGTMGPPQVPPPTATTPTLAAARPVSQSPAQTPTQPQAHPPQASQTPGNRPLAASTTPSPSPSVPPRPLATAGGPAAVPLTATPPMTRTPSNPSPAPGSAAPSHAAGPVAAPASGTPSAPSPRPPTQGSASTPTPTVTKAVTPAPASATPAAPAANPPTPKPTAHDPVIAMLAQKASGDPELRDLMKKVAVGKASPEELNQFQKIIDQLNAEHRRQSVPAGPPADRLFVDNRTVKYFADEVRTILDIVLASNPKQKSTELRPPPGSDPLVVLLVKRALEDQRTKDMIRNIAENRPGHGDAQGLKDILEKLHREMKPAPRPPPQPVQQAKQPVANGPANSHGRAQGAGGQGNPQSLRSKGPPPAPKPDISAVLFDFGGGDRYLFPKFSILEYLPTSSGQQVVASFLIVRKGSTSEYGDPKLDYYQPVTIRIQTQSGKHLENIARAVAPQDEVARYMDDVMSNMTRAEYVLLAMRLPRATDSDREDGGSEEPKTNGSTEKSEDVAEEKALHKPPVLWTPSRSKSGSAEPRSLASRDPDQDAQTKYRRLINSVASRSTEIV